MDSRAAWVDSSPREAFRPIARIGGKAGWYYGDHLWRLRGFLDRLVGGIGMRRGRRDPDTLRPGEALDFWRVEAVEPDRLLRLAAEMRLPGRAWLQFEVTPEKGGSLIRQTAVFDPVGLLGLVYWYALWGIHQVVFAGMLRNIIKAAGRAPSRVAGEVRHILALPPQRKPAVLPHNPDRSPPLSDSLDRLRAPHADHALELGSAAQNAPNNFRASLTLPDSWESAFGFLSHPGQPGTCLGDVGLKLGIGVAPDVGHKLV